MQQRARRSYKLGNGGNILNCADLVIHQGDGDEQNIFRKLVFEHRKIDETLLIDRQVLHLIAELFAQDPAHREDAFMLGCGDENTTASAASRAAPEAEKGKIVCFGSAGCEDPRATLKCNTWPVA